MEVGKRVYISFYGAYVIGPIFGAAFDAIENDLRKRKNSNAYKSAKLRHDNLENALDTIIFLNNKVQIP